MSDVAQKQHHRGTPPAVALTIAGSDSGGGAGIQADLKTFAAFGVFGASAITAVTAQNTLAVGDVRILDAGFVGGQIRACVDDLPIAAIKTGMLADADIVRRAAVELETLARRDGETVALIVDPVMIATSGARLLDDNAVATLVDELLPRAALVTPNLPEAAALTGCTADTDAETLGKRLLETGAGAALVKGGHASGETCRDLLVTRDSATVFEWPRAAGRYHGTGCAYAAAIAALVARGVPLERAVERAGHWLQQQIAAAFSPERGASLILPFTPETEPGVSPPGAR